jgi:hypothetical protein
MSDHAVCLSAWFMVPCSHSYLSRPMHTPTPYGYAVTQRIFLRPIHTPSPDTYAFTRHLRLHPMDTTSDMAEIQTHSKRQTIRPARRVNIPHPMHAYILVVSMYDLDNPRRSHTYTSNREQDQPPMKLQTERWTN